MALETAAADVVLLVARVLFGGVLAFMGLNHFTNGDEMAEYAEMKGIPAAGLAVPASGGLLVFGGVALAFLGVLDGPEVRLGHVQGGEGLAALAGETRQGALSAVVPAAVRRRVHQYDEVLLVVRVGALDEPDAGSVGHGLP